MAAVACLCLASPLALPAQAQTTNFYLWRTTLTVGEDSGTLGYDDSDSLGSISTSAKFGLPPWNPPHKHHVDRDSYHTVDAIYSYVDTEGITFLRINIPGIIRSSPGSVTLWLNHTAYPLTVGSQLGDEAVVFNTLVLPGLAWVEVEPSTVKIDRRREV